jgi:hypothetical protein
MNNSFILPVTPAATPTVRESVIENLATLRQEWEAAAEGDSLLDISASVGLMLLDVAARLGLTPAERAFLLGERLTLDAASILEDQQG